jgi:predicted MFS family arabinose efflux permease
MTASFFTSMGQSFSGIPRIIWLLSGVSLINRAGTMVVCFLSIYLTQQLGFDLRSAGYVLVFYGIGTIIGLYIGGWLTDKIGYRRVQIWSLLLAGTAFISAMYVRAFWPMCAVTFLFGFFGDAFRPANQVAIRLHSDEATRTRAFSLMRIAVNLAISVALIGGGYLVKLGWHWLFWVDGLTCFAAVLLLYFFVKEKKTPPQYAINFDAKTRDNKQININKKINILELSAYQDKKYLFFTCLTLIGATVFIQILWTVPVFFKDVYHWDESQIGIATTLNALIVMIVEMPLIFRVENRRPPMWFIRLGIFLYGLAYLAFLLPAKYAVLAVVLYMIPISFGEIFAMPFSTSWATKRAGTTRQGQYMGLYGMAYSVSNVIAPLLGTQVIAAFGYSALWFLMAAMSAVAFIGFWFLERLNDAESPSNIS